MRSVPRPIEFFEGINPKSVKDIIKSDNPSVVILIQDNGDAEVKAFLVELISDVVSFFSVGKTMNASQIMSTVELIIEAYGQYKIDDWKLCFKKAKLGEFGITYDRIDGNVIFDWFDKYLNLREEEFERLRIKQHKNLEKALNQINEAVPMPEYIKELITKKKPEQKQEYVLNQTEQQKNINAWMADFDELWVQQGISDGKRFVVINDKRMDISEYLEYRNNEQIQK